MYWVTEINGCRSYPIRNRFKALDKFNSITCKGRIRLLYFDDISAIVEKIRRVK